MIDKSAFRPINDDHAIQSVKFVVAFKNLITPESVQRVADGHSNWSESLPAFTLNEASIEAGSRTIQVPVATFAFLLPNGAANWSMAVGGNQIGVECFLYTRWNRVWDAAANYINQVAELLNASQTSLQLASIDLTVRDVFLSAERDYTLSDLFNKASGYISPSIFDIKTAWHCNLGWFEPVNDSTVTLNHLNTDATPSGEQGWAIGITHFQQERTASAISVERVVHTIPSILDASMTRMHDSNKRLLSRLLRSEITSKIGLFGGRNGQSG